MDCGSSGCWNLSTMGPTWLPCRIPFDLRPPESSDPCRSVQAAGRVDYIYGCRCWTLLRLAGAKEGQMSIAPAARGDPGEPVRRVTRSINAPPTVAGEQQGADLEKKATEPFDYVYAGDSDRHLAMALHFMPEDGINREKV